jgi:hypothetical protein
MMETEGNVEAMADAESADDLKMINGIGPVYAKALREIGIRRFEDLAGYTAQELSKALREQAGAKVQPERIEAADWVGQAQELAEQKRAECTSPNHPVEPAEPAEEEPRASAWRQQAGFSLFFDQVGEEEGNQEWRTRVYHDESGEETSFSETEPASWVKWIIERAELPAVEEPVPAEPEITTEPAPALPNVVEAGEPEPQTTQIQILDVHVAESGPSSGVPEKRIMAEVHFHLAGPGAEELTEQEPPFRVEVHAVNLESGDSDLVASERRQLQSHTFDYVTKQSFPIPELGRYELHSIVLLLPPGEMIAHHYEGPTFKVVP